MCVFSTVDCSECGEGSFLAAPCNETAGVDRECKACSLRCGEGVTDCRPDGEGDALCKECNFDTDVDVYIQRSSTESEGYGYCKFCSSCRPGNDIATVLMHCFVALNYYYADFSPELL